MSQVKLDKFFNKYSTWGKENQKLFLIFLEFLQSEIELSNFNPKVKSDNILFFDTERNKRRLFKQKNEFENHLIKYSNKKNQSQYLRTKYKLKIIEDLLDHFEELENDEDDKVKLNIYNSFIHIDKEKIRKEINNKEIIKFIQILSENNIIKNILDIETLKDDLNYTSHELYLNENLKSEVHIFQEYSQKVLYYKYHRDLLQNKNLVGIDYGNGEIWDHPVMHQLKEKTDELSDAILIKRIPKADINNLSELIILIKKERDEFYPKHNIISFNYDNGNLKIQNHTIHIRGGSQRDVLNLFFLMKEYEYSYKTLSNRLTPNNISTNDRKRDATRIGAACIRLAKLINSEYPEKKVFQNIKSSLILKKKFTFLKTSNKSTFLT